MEAGERELDRFLNHMDEILRLLIPVYEKGVHCAVYFNLLNSFSIPRSLEIKIQEEVNKRDEGVPSITYHKEKLYIIVLANPKILTNQKNDSGKSGLNEQPILSCSPSPTYG